MMTTAPTSTRRAGLLVTLATIAVLAILGWIVVAISPELPDPVATHWGANGQADGFTAIDDLWTLLAIPVVLAVLLLPIAVMAGRLPDGVGWLAGLPLGTSLGVGTIAVGSLVAQRGLDDAATAAFPGWLIPLGVVLGVVGTVAAARLVPRRPADTTSAAAPPNAVRAQLPDESIVVWHGTTPAAPAITWIAIGMVALGAWLSWGVSWWLLAIFAPLVVLLLTSARFDVTIGPTGVRASAGLLGWPRVEAPLATITQASATSIRFVDFGGWGIRVSPTFSETGVITRYGPALQIERAGGNALVISMTDPEVPAGIINTLLDRREPDDDHGAPVGTATSTHDDEGGDTPATAGDDTPGLPPTGR